MRITNATLSVARNDARTWLDGVASELSIHLLAHRYPLRAAIVQVTDREAVIEILRDTKKDLPLYFQPLRSAATD